MEEMLESYVPLVVVNASRYQFKWQGVRLFHLSNNSAKFARPIQ
jgi:hypothetical protein